MCTAERNVQGRTGSDTRVRLNARTTGAVDPRFRYDSLVYSLHYESQDSIGCVRSDSCFSSRLPLVVCAVHMHALRLLYILVPYVCDVSRLAPVCSYATLCYTHVCARLTCWVISFPTCIYCYIVIHPCTPISFLSHRQSYCGCSCTIAVLVIELIVEY